MARQPGPNDFHFAASDSGTLVMKPGLGEDEPDELTKEQVLADAEANARREDALDRAAKELATEAETLDRKAAELEERERKLREWEQKLSAQQAVAEPETARRGTAKQATERSGS